MIFWIIISFYALPRYILNVQLPTKRASFRKFKASSHIDGQPFMTKSWFFFKNTSFYSHSFKWSYLKLFVRDLKYEPAFFFRHDNSAYQIVLKSDVMWWQSCADFRLALLSFAMICPWWLDWHPTSALPFENEMQLF